MTKAQRRDTKIQQISRQFCKVSNIFLLADIELEGVFDYGYESNCFVRGLKSKAEKI